MTTVLLFIAWVTRGGRERGRERVRRRKRGSGG